MNTSMENLQTLVSEADACNTRINKTLNAVVEANGGKEPFHSQLLACHKENDACGKKHGEIATWRKEHEAEFHAPAPPVDPHPPVTNLPPLPVPPAAGSVGGRWAVSATEAPQHFLFDGPASRVSIAVADGKQVWIGYHAQPDQFVEGQASASSGTAVVFSVPAGRWYVNYKISPGMGGVAHGDISAY